MLGSVKFRLLRLVSYMVVPLSGRMEEDGRVLHCQASDFGCVNSEIIRWSLPALRNRDSFIFFRNLTCNVPSLAIVKVPYRTPLIGKSR
jgi:hypothetical protein